jgi:hypothetical protein
MLFYDAGINPRARPPAYFFEMPIGAGLLRSTPCCVEVDFDQSGPRDVSLREIHRRKLSRSVGKLPQLTDFFLFR